ncbi:MAG: phosphate ABC transporter substrate-binding protein PstS, partial [Vulcanococcus sp.]
MPRSFRRRLPLLGGSLGLIGALALGGCGQRSGGGGSSSLQGAGATFPAPLYQRWFQELAGQGGARVNYQSVGSGAG